MKVFLQAYLNNNFGDDLFVYIITNRYKNTKFEAMTLYKSTAKFNSNFKLRFKRTGKFVNKIIKLISFNNSNLENELMKKSDCTCFIGGSMFIEYDDSLKQKYYIGGGKQYYIIGTNFGPYKTQDYYNRFYKIFENAEDVCFRDEKSYNLFSNLKNVRFAPDIAFNLNYKIDSSLIENRVVISCIDCKEKIGIEYKEIYERKISELMVYFRKLNYKITLMSFCKNEGDEEAIKSILNKLDNCDRQCVDVYNYNGDIDTALKILSTSKIIIGSRFHANILGMVMNKTIIPIAYSDKTINALKDIDFNGLILDIRNIKDFNVNSITDRDLNYVVKTDNIKNNAQKHFEKLDKILN